MVRPAARVMVRSERQSVRPVAHVSGSPSQLVTHRRQARLAFGFAEQRIVRNLVPVQPVLRICSSWAWLRRRRET